jgi:hypothetical protein
MEKTKNVNMNSKMDLFSITVVLQDNYYWTTGGLRSQIKALSCKDVLKEHVRNSRTDVVQNPAVLPTSFAVLLFMPLTPPHVACEVHYFVNCC